MIGTIVGDIIGSYYEFSDEKGRDLPLFHKESCFTDDSILSAAIADAILKNPTCPNYKESVLLFANRHITSGHRMGNVVRPGFGAMFTEWVLDEDGHEPYGSFGNGSCMRTIPVAWAYDESSEMLRQARLQSSITHNHPSAILSAKAVSAVGYMLKKGVSAKRIIMKLKQQFNIDAELDLDVLHREYTFDVTAIGTVGPAIACVLYANSFENVMRNVLYIGGDTDTIGAIAGGLGEMRFGVPRQLAGIAESILYNHGEDILQTVREFEMKYGKNVL